MRFSVNQVFETVDGIPKILSTDIKMLSESSDLYSLARDYLDEIDGLIFVQRDQYAGYKKKKKYCIVLMPRQDKLIVCHREEFIVEFDEGRASKLFPYLWETEIKTLNQLHEFFQHISLDTL